MPNPVDDQEEKGGGLCGALARWLAEDSVRGSDWESEFNWDLVTDPHFRRSFKRKAEALLAGPLASLLTQVETLTRERDEALREHADMMRQRRRSDERAVAVFADLQAAEARALTAEAERDDLYTQLRAAREALEPFLRFSCSFDGFGFDDADLEFRGRRIGTMSTSTHAEIQQALDAARSLLNPRSGANG